MGPFALLARHELRDCYPYKVMSSTLGRPLGQLGSWLPLGLLIVLVVTLALLWRRPSWWPAAAMVGALLVTSVAFLAVVMARSEGIPLDGDFGLRGALTAFRQFLLEVGGFCLALGVAGSLFSRHLRKPGSTAGGSAK